MCEKRIPLHPNQSLPSRSFLLVRNAHFTDRRISLVLLSLVAVVVVVVGCCVFVFQHPRRFQPLYEMLLKYFRGERWKSTLAGLFPPFCNHTLGNQSSDGLVDICELKERMVGLNYWPVKGIRPLFIFNRFMTSFLRLLEPATEITLLLNSLTRNNSTKSANFFHGGVTITAHKVCYTPSRSILFAERWKKEKPNQESK